MKNKTIYTKPCIKALNVEAGSLLAGSGGITGEIPDIPWANSKPNDISDELDDVSYAETRHLLSDTFNDAATDY